MSPTTGHTSFSSPGTVSASVNPTGLTPGIYKGAVNFAFSATAVRSVNVTLVVENSGPATTSSIHSDAAGSCTPSQLVPTSTGLVSNFAAPAAWPVPLGTALVDDCGNSISNGQIVATFSNGDPPLILTLADPTNPLPTYVATRRRNIALGADHNQCAGQCAGFWGSHGADCRRGDAQQCADSCRSSGREFLQSDRWRAARARNADPDHGTVSVEPVNGRTFDSAAADTGRDIGDYRRRAGANEHGESWQVNAQVLFELPAGQPYQVIVNANNALTTPQSFQAGAASPGLAVLPSGYVEAGHARAGPP